MHNKDILLEEYKIATSRQESHEARYFQMLVFCVTGFVTIIGFSEKIPKEAIPYMLNVLLLLTCKLGCFALQQDKYDAAFLIERFEGQLPNLSFHTLYSGIFEKKETYNSIPGLKLIKSCIHPFIFLAGITANLSLYYGGSAIVGYVKEKYWVVAALYIIPIIIMLILSARIA